MNVWPLPRITFRALSDVKERRRTALITEPTASGARGALSLPVIVQSEPEKTDAEFSEYLAASLPSAVEVIYVVGDDVLLDIGKFVAQKVGKPLVMVPTTLDSDKAFSAHATLGAPGARKNIETGPAGEVVLDLDLLQDAPPHHRTAGIVDVISIVTGLLDWGYASQKGHSEFVAWAAGVAAGLASQALKSAGTIGEGKSAGLRTLADFLALKVQLDNLLGHTRASQGAEHIFAEAVMTEATVVEVNHAERVAPGILLAAALHNKDSVSLRSALTAAGVRVEQLKRDDVRSTFARLPGYVKANETPFTILNDLDAGSEAFNKALEQSTLFPQE